MSKQIVLKYFQESEFVKEPCQATEVSAGYDLYVAETRAILSNSADSVSLGQFLVDFLARYFHVLVFQKII